MSENKKNSFAIFISAGLGDAVLLLPLIKRLKKDNYHLTAIITSSFNCEALFEHSDLFDEIVILRSKVSKLTFALKHLHYFQKSIINYFAASRSNLMLANSISKEVVCNNTENKSNLLNKRIVFKTPEKNIHDALQNLQLFYKKENILPLNLNDFQLKLKSVSDLSLPAPYIVVQTSTGNNNAPYKTWPLIHWLSLIEKIQQKYPHLNIVLLGDKNEIGIENALQKKNKKLISLIGKTSISQVWSIISNALLFVGLDGGPMHVAATVDAPTFTIWGGSDPELYAYHHIDGTKHRIIKKTMSCGPCNSWINPNTSKTGNPLKCPDFECLTSLSPETVFAELVTFIASLEINA